MSDDAMLEHLRSVPLFAGLKDRELKDVLGRSREVEHTGGEIVEEGAKGVGFHLILEGTATVLQHGEVRRTLGVGDYFGEISLIDGKPRSASVRPDGPIRTLSLAAWNFEPLLEKHPLLAHELLLGLCAHVREAEARGTV
jgi:CRP/FNR family transcriptional regulator, cyclic AMP receptor protein